MIWLVAVAWGQQDAALCKGGFTETDWSVRLQSAQDAFASFEIEVARRLLDKTRAQLACLEEVADPALIARLAQQLAWLAFLDQDESAVQRWLLLARAADPELPLPDALPPDHPLRSLSAELEEPRVATADGRIVPPKGGGLFLDGRLLLEAKGWAEVPGLLQIADGSGKVLETRWIDGGQIPAEWLDSPGPPPKAPRWWEPGAPDTVVVERSGSGPRVPVLAAGIGCGVLSGGLYALGAVAAGGLDGARTETDLAAARSRVNVLAMSSLAAGVGAVGLGVTAFVSADGGGVTFRF